MDKLDSLVVGDDLIEGNQIITETIGYGFDYFTWIRNFAEEIRLIKKEVMGIYNAISVSEAEVFIRDSSSRASSSTADQETVVGFDDEAMAIIEELIGIKRQLEVIPVVVMGGLD